MACRESRLDTPAAIPNLTIRYGLPGASLDTLVMAIETLGSLLWLAGSRGFDTLARVVRSGFCRYGCGSRGFDTLSEPGNPRMAAMACRESRLIHRRDRSVVPIVRCGLPGVAVRYTPDHTALAAWSRGLPSRGFDTLPTNSVGSIGGLPESRLRYTTVRRGTTDATLWLAGSRGFDTLQTMNASEIIALCLPESRLHRSSG